MNTVEMSIKEHLEKTMPGIKVKVKAGPVLDWKPIDTAPQDGTKFLAYEGNDESQFYICWYENQFSTNWAGWQTVWDDEPEPTHWCDLPNTPES